LSVYARTYDLSTMVLKTTFQPEAVATREHTALRFPPAKISNLKAPPMDASIDLVRKGVKLEVRKLWAALQQGMVPMIKSVEDRVASDGGSTTTMRGSTTTVRGSTTTMRVVHIQL
jgi:hypothetical protein